MIRAVNSTDFQAIADIYNYYILNTFITFEEEAVTAQEMGKRIQETTSLPLPWLVAEVSKQVVGYAYATKWKGRCAYRHSVEISVYLDPATTGNGIGSELYTALFAALQQQSIHAVIGGIALPNPASIALHEKLGLQKVAHFKEVGFKFNQWIDVGYWQMCFDTSSVHHATE